jgi:two-component system, sensor histidine kinase and response regulator
VFDCFVVAERVHRRAAHGEPSHAPHVVRGATILMLTSATRSHDVQRCHALGIAAYLLKPISQRELRGHIERVLRQAPGGLPAPRLGPAGPIKHERSLRVLLAEDNAINAKLASVLLRKFGHSVAIVEDGSDAVAACAREAFDLVLMDVQMPTLDGLAATRHIRDHERATGRHVPIIAMTASAMSGDREECLDAGMDDYVTKPVAGADLAAAIERHTGLRRIA